MSVLADPPVTGWERPRHPALVAVEEVRRALAGVSDVDPVYLSPGEKQSLVTELAAAEASVVELRLRVLAASDDAADAAGARDAGAWFAHLAHADPREARADLHLAKALDRYARVAAGVRDGDVTVAQARVIVRVLDDLPERHQDLGPTLRERAEATLVGYCGAHSPKELRLIGRRIIEIVAPEVVDAEDARRLAAEERAAKEKASLRFSDLGDGRTRLAGVLPTPVAHRFRTYLQAYTSPRQPAGLSDGLSGGLNEGERTGMAPGERLPQHRAYAAAFTALLENLDPHRLPAHGGDATTVVVTVDLADLRADLATAGVLTEDGTEVITAAEARRLACQASVLPMVLGGDSEVLDLGRARRLFSPAQRKAMRIRDQHCRAEGCTIPAAWCEAHHWTPWSQGGRTDLDDGGLLCSVHHHRIHSPDYDTRHLPDGTVRFHRRT